MRYEDGNINSYILEAVQVAETTPERKELAFQILFRSVALVNLFSWPHGIDPSEEKLIC